MIDIKFKKEDNKRLRDLVERITMLSIGKQNPKGFCFSTSFVLSIYLDSQGYSNNIISGKMNGVDHFWIKLDNDDDIIIDATLKQFDSENNQEDSIYIGEISENKITNQYKQDYISFKEWIDLYERWCNPEKFPAFDKQEDSFVKKLILNNLIGASILAYEIEKLKPSIKSNIVSSYFYKLYLNPILNGLKNKWITDENLLREVRLNTGEEFKVLLSKLALKNKSDK